MMDTLEKTETNSLPIPKGQGLGRDARHGRRLFTAVVVFIVLAVAVYPVLVLLVRSFQTSQPWEPVQFGLDNWRAAYSHALLPRTVIDTVLLGFSRVALAAGIGIFFAWAVARTDMPLKRPLEVGLWLGFFVPALPMAFGWILLLDPQFGLVNDAIRSIFPSFSGLDVYSRWGIVWSNLARSTSVVFILTSPAFRNLDAALEEAGAVSGLSRLQTLRRITLPIVGPAVGIATILVLVKSLESFEIELLLGIPGGIYVYSTLVWLFLRFEPPAYGAATALSVVFLVALLLAIAVRKKSLGDRDFTTVSARGFSTAKIRLGRARWLFSGAAVLFIAVFIAAPLVMLVAGTFMRVFGFFDIPDPWTVAHWQAVLTDDNFQSSLVRSLVLGFGAAILGVSLYAIVAYWLQRTTSKLRGLVDTLSWLPWALPGVLVGLAMLWVFLGSGRVVALLYGTLSVLILAIVIKEFPLGVQMVQSGMAQIDPGLEEAARTSGLSRPAAFRRIVLPLIRPTLIMVGLISFITAVREIPAVVFLTRSADAPLAPKMLFLMEEGLFERAVVYGLITTVLVLLAAVVSLRLNLRSMDRIRE